MLDEKTRALLGDREAQEAITARGCWCRVRSAGETQML